MANDETHKTIQPEGGKSYLVFSDIITFKVTAEDTDGAYSIVEAISPPGSGPSFLHTHIPQETFYIIEGTYEIYGQNSGGKYAIPASPGSVVHVPGGVPHGFKNVGEIPGKMILTYRPAQPMIDFFEEVGIPIEDKTNLPEPQGSPDVDLLISIFARHQFGLIEPLPLP